VVRLLLSLACAAGLALSSFTPEAAAAAARVVAIGDVHGGDAAFVAILQKTGIIDGNRQWAGGKAVLVQTGDVTDRGAGVRASLDLLMALERQAPKAGGRVRMALGNHEVMNMLGETRDVTPEIFASFGGERAYREAMGPKGHYGKWLRSHPAIIKIDDSVFMHAGINPDITTDSIDALNDHIRQQIDGWDRAVADLEREELVRPLAPIAEVVGAAAAAKLPLADVGNTHLFHPDGILWFRGYSAWTDAEGADKVRALLRRYRVKRLVTGHTVQRGGIRARFNGGLYLIDTGLLGGKYYPGGRASALEIKGSTVTPLYVE
jgi:hypothetical protein